MEAMAKEVVDYSPQGNFGGKLLSSLRGIKDEYIFDDEANMKEFSALSEGIRDVTFS